MYLSYKHDSYIGMLVSLDIIDNVRDSVWKPYNRNHRHTLALKKITVA